MTRKEVRVCIKMRTNGGIYVCPSVIGDIIVYEDQLIAINNKISKCRTREEAKEIIRDFSCGLDLHHADVQVPTIRKKTSIRLPPRPSIQKKTPMSSVSKRTESVQGVSTRATKKTQSLQQQPESPQHSQARIVPDSIQEVL